MSRNWGHITRNEKLDVIGIHAQQERSEAEARLATLGFNTENPQIRTVTGETWTSEILAHRREGEGVGGDVFTLHYAPVLEGTDKAEQVASIIRK